MARAARGRNELELRRVDETDKRQNRFRAQVQVRASVAGVIPCCEHSSEL